jgi:tripartite-type tricarboxylate transporter receptor subunit TctC
MSVRLSQIVGVCLLLACTFAQSFAQSDIYPDKPIRIITHSAAGGAPDVMLRIVGDRAARQLLAFSENRRRLLRLNLRSA